MNFLRRCALLAFVVVTPALLAASARKQPTRPAADTGGYKGAIVIDAATGKVLFEDNADVVSPPASMTKLMTFAVVYDKLASRAIALNTAVKVTVEDSKKGGTQVFLDPRETFPVEELLYAMMIQSANDAANALARTAAGSAEAFVELMNAKAQQLGMKNTHFRTPHGLPPDSRKFADSDLTTPRDYAILSRHLVQNTDVLKYTSVRTRSFGEGVRAKPMLMTNHNHLLGRVGGVDGLKTGFTNGAGFCLSATAQRNGRRIIAVAMGSAQAKTRDLKVTELLERGFAALPPAPAAPVALPNSPIAPAPKATATLTPAAATAQPATTPTTPAAPAAHAASSTAAPADPNQPNIRFAIPKR